MGLRWRSLRPISELFIIIQTSESIWSNTTNYHSLCHQCCLIHYISKSDNYEPITIHLEFNGTINPKQANKRSFRIRSKHNITLHKQKTASLSTSLPWQNKWNTRIFSTIFMHIVYVSCKLILFFRSATIIYMFLLYLQQSKVDLDQLNYWLLWKLFYVSVIFCWFCKIFCLLFIWESYSNISDHHTYSLDF